MAVHAGNGASPLAAARGQMLELLQRRIGDPRVVDAMAAVPREAFVPAALRYRAYEDGALPIGEGQTISQPLIVALMIEALALTANDRLLEVGSGSGYAAAVASRIVREVIGVERMPALRERSEHTIAALGFSNIRFIDAGAVLGCPDEAPFDAILVSAGAPHVPRVLVEQLAEGGRLVVPVGKERGQELVRVTRTTHGLELARMGPCAFVPLIGEGAWPG